MSEAEYGIAGVVLGVVLGSVLTVAKEWFSEWRERKRRANYLAIRVVCILDQYVERCIEVVGDGGVQTDEDGTHSPQVSLPSLSPFPQDIDWKALPPDLMYRILSFPSEIDAAIQAIDFICSEIAFPPYYEECFEERQYQHAILGLSASDLAGVLRKTYALPERKRDGRDPIVLLAEHKAKIEEERQISVSIRDSKIRSQGADEEVDARE